MLPITVTSAPILENGSTPDTAMAPERSVDSM